MEDLRLERIIFLYWKYKGERSGNKRQKELQRKGTIYILEKGRGNMWPKYILSAPLPLRSNICGQILNFLVFVPNVGIFCGS